MSLCGRCARLGSTCCQGTDVVLGPGDVERIRSYTGNLDFLEYRPPADPSDLGADGDPNWVPYTLQPDGTRRVLRHAGPSDCFFLGRAGCLLPAEVRPLICRLHPLSYTEQTIRGVECGCPRELLEPGEDFYCAVGIDLERAREWHRCLYEELRSGSPALG